MGCLCTNSYDCCGVIGNGIIVERETFGTHKFVVAMVGFLLGGLGEDGHKGIGSPQLVVGDDHERRKKSLLDGDQVVIGWFPFKRGKGLVGLFEEAGDGIGRHFWLIVANNYSRMRGVASRLSSVVSPRGGGKVA